MIHYSETRLRGDRQEFPARERAQMSASPTAEQYLELLLGPKGPASVFASEEARRQAWLAHAAELTPLVDAGSRPWAWWQYEAPEPLLPRESELAYLIRCGLLTPEERKKFVGAAVSG